MGLDQGVSFEQQENTQHGRYLTFVIGDEVYGIAIRFVTEIISMQPVSKLPEAPPYVKGVINLRGNIIPVVDMRLRFNKKATAYTDRTCIVVVETQRLTAGLIVDEVTEVLIISEESISPPPDIQTHSCQGYLSGIGKANGTVMLLLDCEKLFSTEEAKKMDEIN